MKRAATWITLPLALAFTAGCGGGDNVDSDGLGGLGGDRGVGGSSTSDGGRQGGDGGSDGSGGGSGDGDGGTKGSGGEPIDPKADRDGDGLTDLEEVEKWGTSPTVADTDGDGFSDSTEVRELAFDPEVDNFQFNPLIADHPQLAIELASAPLIYATYETSSSASKTIGNERSEETRSANTSTWGGSNSTAVEQSHTVGASVGFSGWSMEASVSYEYSYSTTNESTNDWSTEQTEENAETLSEMESYESSNSISSSGGVLAVSVKVKNGGDIAYFLDNLTLTAYELDPLNPSNVSPIGTLTLLDLADAFPRIALEPGEESSLLTFQTELDLPTVKALLANSRNLMLAPATWLVEGDGTVDFELATTAVRARTAEIIIDYGLERQTESYRVSTVTREDRNYVTVGDALSNILKIPFTEGSTSLRRTPSGTPKETEKGLLSVRNFGTDDDDATLWTVVHSYPVDNGANTQIDQYHPFNQEVDFSSLQLKKGHSLQLTRIEDPDRDGLGERTEYAYGTDPANPDSDGDGCDDGFEVTGWDVGSGASLVHYRSDPTLKNTDFDLYDDCEEYQNGTDPMSVDNHPPTVGISIASSDGVEATFSIEYDDAETGVTELYVSVDGNDPVVIDVSGDTSPESVTRSFSTGGNHTVTVTSFDGQLMSASDEVIYSVGPSSSGLVHHYAVQDSTQGGFFGQLADSAGSTPASAENVYFTTGRDGLGGGAFNTNFNGDAGLVTVDAPNIGASFTLSAWVQVYGVYSSIFVFGQDESFVLEADTGSLNLYDLSSSDFADDASRIGSYDFGDNSWDESPDFYFFTVVVSGTTAYFYVDGTLAFSGAIGSSVRACDLFFGQTDLDCNGPEPAESHENGFNGIFDEIRIYNRALSANEVKALML